MPPHLGYEKGHEPQTNQNNGMRSMFVAIFGNSAFTRSGDKHDIQFPRADDISSR